jgi:hypothetical protein
MVTTGHADDAGPGFGAGETSGPSIRATTSTAIPPAVAEAQSANSTSRSWPVIAALTVVVVAIATVAVLGVIQKNDPVTDTGPLPIASFDQPGVDSAACRSLMPTLPQQLAGEKRRTLEGATDGIAAWGDPATILRCGLETPAELTCSSALTQVDGVAWLQLPESGSGETTYIAADRSVRIALTIPDGSGTGEIQQISDLVAAALPARAPCDNGILLPTDTK